MFGIGLAAVVFPLSTEAYYQEAISEMTGFRFFCGANGAGLTFRRAEALIEIRLTSTPSAFMLSLCMPS